MQRLLMNPVMNLVQQLCLTFTLARFPHHTMNPLPVRCENGEGFFQTPFGKTLFALVVLLVSTSCAAYRADYHVPLQKVAAYHLAHDHVAVPQQQQRTEIEVELQPNQPYHHAVLQMQWWLTPQHLVMRVTNTTQDTLTIDWSKAKYVDETGTSYRVVLEGVHPRFAEREARLTHIAPGAQQEERCYPTKCIAQYGRSFSRYPLLPVAAMNRQTLTNELQSLMGKELELWIPVETRSDSYTFVFTFVVQRADLMEPQL